ncbi:hypothetical protein KCP69_25735 [Salmonella enterica subsp. enterica]|nr:hypothetical protein KCP69_25735 [Salmonella enterica subsp. enterica]
MPVGRYDCIVVDEAPRLFSIKEHPASYSSATSWIIASAWSFAVSYRFDAVCSRTTPALQHGGCFRRLFTAATTGIGRVTTVTRIDQTAHSDRHPQRAGVMMAHLSEGEQVERSEPGYRGDFADQRHAGSRSGF